LKIFYVGYFNIFLTSPTENKPPLDWILTHHGSKRVEPGNIAIFCLHSSRLQSKSFRRRSAALLGDPFYFLVFFFSCRVVTVVAYNLQFRTALVKKNAEHGGDNDWCCPLANISKKQLRKQSIYY